MVCLGKLTGYLTNLFKHQVWVLYDNVVAKRQLIQGGLQAGTQRVKGASEQRPHLCQVC